MRGTVADYHAEPHTGYVEDSLCNHKADGEEEVGGWDEGDGHQTQAKQELPLVAVSGAHGIAAHGEEAGKRGQSEQVAGVGEGGDGGNGVHGVLGTQLGGA